METYGKELILDLQGCDPKTFNRECIGEYFVKLCDLIDMERVEVHWWDDLTHPDVAGYEEDHLIGTSAIQFIKTSNITIHCLDRLKKVFLNIFSCKEFDTFVAMDFSKQWFGAQKCRYEIIPRL